MSQLLSWQWLCRIVGLALIAGHVLTSPQPDAGVILALLGLVGLPTFVDADKRRKGE